MPRTQHTAGAFDIRNIIGGLIGLYGIILVLMGLFGDQELAKTGDVNANLWAGLAMVVIAAIFLGWAWLRPVRVPEEPTEQRAEQPERPPAQDGG
ncbi:hypothetical protein [Nocardioides sp. YIM 152315]|uniref:hypothetical protein n=1 Tax=Nocardioides sp. YIM 152315 TaxID=3031760 RepID=UPI0023DAA2E5|nr:hypothetical protein [Nocardioides sp. YIM 152315]MDF1603256.1 hypothetical protein [Nocardioides sp. YIM 152315]